MRKELKARTCKQESWSNIIVTCWLPLCVLFFSKVFYMIQDQEKFKDPLVQKLQSLIKVLNFCVVSYLSSSLFSFPFISLKLWNRVPLLKDYFCCFYFFYWKSFFMVKRCSFQFLFSFSNYDYCIIKVDFCWNHLNIFALFYSICNFNGKFIRA